MHESYIIEQLEMLMPRIKMGEAAIEKAKLEGKKQRERKYETIVAEMKRRYNYLNQAYMLQRHLPMLIRHKECVFAEVIRMRIMYFVINDVGKESYIAYRKAQSELFKQEDRHALLEAFNTFETDYDFSNTELFLHDMQSLLIEIVKDVMRGLDQVCRIPSKEKNQELKVAS